jgi:alkyldihydroxyacetonephosphate synthase
MMNAQSPHSYLQPILEAELESVVGPDGFRSVDADCLCYAVDYYWVPRLWFDRDMPMPKPQWIVKPRSTQEVADVLRIANHYRLPVTPWGGGSGSQGGALPVQGGIVLDLKRLNSIVRFDEQSLTVTAQTGIIQQTLETWLQQRNYSMMHFAASIRSATLGGFLAHRGTGVLSTKYGKIEDMVLSLEVVLPTGEIIRTAPVPRHAAGPDLTQLFVGSEGTLGVITEATMKVHPQPEARHFRAYLFDTLSAGLEAGRRLMVARLGPSTIRLYDELETHKVVKRVLGIDVDGAYMVVGYEGYKVPVEFALQRTHEICTELGAQDLGEEPGQHWWDHQLDFYYPPHTLDLPEAFGTMDTVATYDAIEDVYHAMKDAVEAISPDITFMAHFSHWYEWGCMMYDRFVIKEPPEDAAEAIRLYNRVWHIGIEAALKAGGMINEHHGIGLKLASFMEKQYGPAFNLLTHLKEALDPNGIMNPGKLGFPFPTRPL